MFFFFRRYQYSSTKIEKSTTDEKNPKSNNLGLLEVDVAFCRLYVFGLRSIRELQLALLPDFAACYNSHSFRICN